MSFYVENRHQRRSYAWTAQSVEREKKLEKTISSGEEPHCPPLTAGLRPSLSLSFSEMTVGPRPASQDHTGRSAVVEHPLRFDGEFRLAALP